MFSPILCIIISAGHRPNDLIVDFLFQVSSSQKESRSSRGAMSYKPDVNETAKTQCQWSCVITIIIADYLVKSMPRLGGVWFFAPDKLRFLYGDMMDGVRQWFR